MIKRPCQPTTGEWRRQRLTNLVEVGGRVREDSPQVEITVHLQSPRGLQRLGIPHHEPPLEERVTSVEWIASLRIAMHDNVIIITIIIIIRCRSGVVEALRMSMSCPWRSASRRRGG
jgi:hypothetical protein